MTGLDSLTSGRPELADGDSDSFNFELTRLRVQNGDWIDLPRAGVTAVVGGNNVGKSTLLRQIVTQIGSDPGSPLGGPPLLTALETLRSGGVNDLFAWLAGHASVATSGTLVGFSRPSAGFLEIGGLDNYWTHPHYAERLSRLGTFFVQYADAQRRFDGVAPVERRTDLTDPPTSAIHQLEDAPDKLTALSAIFERAFGHPLLLDPLSGALMLRVGVPSIEAPPVDRISTAYRDAVGALPRVDEQGDGMRSMLGVLLPLIASDYPVIVVDEPEAFLHPPQARILGKALGELAHKANVQVILATHDRNILTGLLDAGDTAITVVRLSRHQDQTTALQLDATQLRSVWSNPALRYSNVLDGLFHRMVVLAENERDCRFYAASLDAAHRDGAVSVSPNEILFVPTAGKSNMKALAAILVACGVPVVACADLDVLNDETTIRTLVEALGGTWEPMQASWLAATAEFRTDRAPRLNRDVAASITAVLDESPEEIYTAATRQRVSSAMRVENPWRRLKEFGERAFRAAPQAAEALLVGLDARGVVLVRLGELEGFAPTLEVSKGLAWVQAAITAGAHESIEARKHIVRIVENGLRLEASSQS